ncbi:hypothetical protein [Brachybacterium huguangmaarense]
MSASAPSASPSPTPATAPVPDPAAPSRGRTALVTAAWWIHGLLRLGLAFYLLVYGVTKVIMMQFGPPDMGDALIPYGQMSPMGVLWRMVALSPLFQVLSGLAEAGAGAALLWRRTVPLGALLGLADMVFVFVLNLGYDVPVKALSLGLAVLSLVVLAPWLPRLTRALLGHGAVGEGPWPRLLPWRRVDRAAGAVAAVVAIAVAVLSMVVAPLVMPRPAEDLSAPTGVWAVVEDSRPGAGNLADDDRIAAVAVGQWVYDGASRATVRLADGTVLAGSALRTAPDRVQLELRPLREPGQTAREWADLAPRELDLTVAEEADGRLRLTGSGEDLVLEQRPGDRLVYDRGFSWEVRPDDPFNR